MDVLSLYFHLKVAFLFNAVLLTFILNYCQHISKKNTRPVASQFPKNILLLSGHSLPSRHARCQINVITALVVPRALPFHDLRGFFFVDL